MHTKKYETNKGNNKDTVKSIIHALCPKGLKSRRIRYVGPEKEVERDMRTDKIHLHSRAYFHISTRVLMDTDVIRIYFVGGLLSCCVLRGFFLLSLSFPMLMRAYSPKDCL